MGQVELRHSIFNLRAMQVISKGRRYGIEVTQNGKLWHSCHCCCAKILAQCNGSRDVSGAMDGFFPVKIDTTSTNKAFEDVPVNFKMN